MPSDVAHLVLAPYANRGHDVWRVLLQRKNAKYAKHAKHAENANLKLKSSGTI